MVDFNIKGKDYQEITEIIDSYVNDLQLEKKIETKEDKITKITLKKKQGRKLIATASMTFSRYEETAMVLCSYKGEKYQKNVCDLYDFDRAIDDMVFYMLKIHFEETITEQVKNLANSKSVNCEFDYFYENFTIELKNNNAEPKHYNLSLSYEIDNIDSIDIEEETYMGKTTVYISSGSIEKAVEECSKYIEKCVR